MNILGLNVFHGDSSVVLVSNGKLVVSVEEERFRRIKHWAGLPTEAIRYCLNTQNISLDQIDIIAINQDSKANLWKKIGFTLAKRPDLGLVLDRIKNKRERESLESQIQNIFPDRKFKGQIIGVEHHFAHLSSAFLHSNLSDIHSLSC